MYAIVNSNGLYFQQMGYNDYSFTSEKEQASKFFSEENAYLKIKKLTDLKGLSVVKVGSAPNSNQLKPFKLS